MFYKGFYLIGINNQNQITARDGSHSRRSGVEKALYLFQSLRLAKADEQYFEFKLPKDVPDLAAFEAAVWAAKAKWKTVTPRSTGINHEAVAIMQGIMPKGK